MRVDLEEYRKLEVDYGAAVHRAQIAEAKLTAAGVKPRVKPLVWEEISDRCWDADGLGKLYRVMLRSDGDGTLKQGVFDRGTDYVSIEAAKAAAQADYEARILSALTTEGE